MVRIPPAPSGTGSARSQELLGAIKAKLGSVPNLFATLALSPAALDGYLGLSGALARGALRPALREQIALALAGRNSCDYFASAHSLFARKAGVSDADIDRGLVGAASDDRAAAALAFATAIVDQRGQVSDQELAAIRSAGFSDAESSRSSLTWSRTSSATTSISSPAPRSTSPL